MRLPSLATTALALLIVSELTVSTAACGGGGSKSQTAVCHGISVSVIFQSDSGSVDFKPVLTVLSRSQGVLEIGFTSKQQSYEEDLKEFGGTSFTLALADAPPTYRVIVDTLGDARRVDADIRNLHGVNTVVVGPDINRPFVTASLQPVGLKETGLYYMGSVISAHCPS